MGRFDSFFGSVFKMALILTKNDGNIKVISSKDSSVKCDEEAYKLYTETLDEELLELEGVPTRFILKKGLNYKEQQIVKDAQIQMKGKEFSISLSYMMEEVRLALVDIENPADLPDTQKILYKKASDGRASQELIALLESAGIVSELFTARSNALGVLSDTTKKK